MSSASVKDKNPSLFRKITKVTGKLIGKVVCIFDDIPFLLKGVLPDALKSIGSYMLAGAGFIAFPVEMYEGVSGLRKGLKQKRKTPGRKTEIVTSATKVGLSAAGIGVSIALLVATIVGLGVAEPILSLLVPVGMAAITSVEWVQNLRDYQLAKKLAKGPARDLALREAKHALGFSSVYVGLSFAIVALATLSTIAALGVATFGIAPVAVLIGVVGLALGVKIFELVNQKKKFALTNAIRAFFFGKKNEKAVEPAQEPLLQIAPSISRSSSADMIAEMGGTSARAASMPVPQTNITEPAVTWQPANPTLATQPRRMIGCRR